MEISEIVRTFALAIVSFQTLLSQQSLARKLSNALKGVGTALGDGTLVIGEESVKADVFADTAAYFDQLVSGEDAARIELTKTASFVQVALDNGLVPDDDVDVATNALQAFAEVVASPKASPSRPLRAAS